MQDLIAQGEFFEFFVQLAAIENLLHEGLIATVDCFLNAVFYVSGEALVEPEVTPGGVGNQVA